MKTINFFILALIFITSTLTAQTFQSEKRIELIERTENGGQYGVRMEQNIINVDGKQLQIQELDLIIETKESIEIVGGEEMSWKIYEVTDNTHIKEIVTNTYFDNQVESITVVYNNGEEVTYSLPLLPNL